MPEASSARADGLINARAGTRGQQMWRRQSNESSGQTGLSLLHLGGHFFILTDMSLNDTWKLPKIGLHNQGSE